MTDLTHNSLPMSTSDLIRHAEETVATMVSRKQANEQEVITNMMKRLKDLIVDKESFVQELSNKNNFLIEELSKRDALIDEIKTVSVKEIQNLQTDIIKKESSILELEKMNDKLKADCLANQGILAENNVLKKTVDVQNAKLEENESDITTLKENEKKLQLIVNEQDQSIVKFKEEIFSLKGVVQNLIDVVNESAQTVSMDKSGEIEIIEQMKDIGFSDNELEHIFSKPL